MKLNLYTNIFRCLIEVALKELEKKRLEYDKSPEKHPLYPDEWKIFWNRRYKELQAGLHIISHRIQNNRPSNINFFF